MRERVLWFLKNDLVFWVFFLCLSTGMIFYILNKEDIKISITFGESYGNKVITFP